MVPFQNQCFNIHTNHASNRLLIMRLLLPQNHVILI